jgi:hypothetical protein
LPAGNLEQRRSAINFERMGKTPHGNDFVSHLKWQHVSQAGITV